MPRFLNRDIRSLRERWHLEYKEARVNGEVFQYSGV